jgi:hypothetical protein
VSSLGRIRRIAPGCSTRPGRIIKPHSVGGYLYLTLRSPDKRSSSKRVHPLVCKAFHGERPTPRHQAAHNNGVRDDNRASNLRWATPEENQYDRVLHGTDIRGSDVHGAVLDESDIPKIKGLLAQYVPSTVIARAWGVSTSTIHLIKHNKIWRHCNE